MPTRKPLWVGPYAEPTCPSPPQSLDQRQTSGLCSHSSLTERGLPSNRPTPSRWASQTEGFAIHIFPLQFCDGGSKWITGQTRTNWRPKSALIISAEIADEK